MKSTTAFKLYAFTVGLAFAAILFIPKHVHAETIMGNQDSCTRMAEDIKFAAELRDSGIPWVTVVFAMEQFLEDSKHQPTSYIKDSDDADNFRSVMQTVYNESSVTPDKLHESFLAYCMRKSV